MFIKKFIKKCYLKFINVCVYQLDCIIDYAGDVEVYSAKKLFLIT